MADVHIPQSIKTRDNLDVVVRLVDAAGTNVAQVTASGELEVTLTTALPAGTNNIGDVDVLTLPATAADGASVPGVGIQIGGRDGSGNLQYIAVDAAGELQVDVLTIPATAADGAAVPAVGVQIGGRDGSGNLQYVAVDTDGNLQVDVLTAPGSSSPTDPKSEYRVKTSLAAAASSGATDLRTSDVATGKTAKLQLVTLSANFPCRWVIEKVSNDVATTMGVLFSLAGDTKEWRPPDKDYVTVAGGTGGFDGFRVVATNQDNQGTGDAHVTLQWDNV